MAADSYTTMFGEDGREVPVLTAQNNRRNISLEGDGVPVPTTRIAMTADGRILSPVGGGRFKIVETGEILSPERLPQKEVGDFNRL